MKIWRVDFMAHTPCEHTWKLTWVPGHQLQLLTDLSDRHGTEAMQSLNDQIDDGLFCHLQELLLFEKISTAK